MREQLEQIKKDALGEINYAKDSKELDDIRIKYLGKKGLLTAILRGMGNLSPEERPIIGKVANEVREEIEGALEQSEQSELAVSAIDNLLKEAKK